MSNNITKNKKISFPNINKRVNTIKLESKNGIDTVVQESSSITDRSKILATYYNMINIIENSKVGGIKQKTLKRLDANEIKKIYKDIFLTSIPNSLSKNNIIDLIIDFLKKYIPENNLLDITYGNDIISSNINTYNISDDGYDEIE